MARRGLLAAAVVLAAGILVPTTAAHAADASHHRGRYLKVGYFTQWGIYDRGFRVRNLVDNGTAARLTHINYAFGNITEDGRCLEVNQPGVGDAWADYQTSFTAEQSVDGVADVPGQALAGNFNQLRKLKKKYPNLKVNLSLGGWTWSTYFSNAAVTPEARRRFAESCIDMFIKGNLPKLGDDPHGGPGAAAGVFDGIDIDWEWPGSPGEPGNVVRKEDKQNFTLMLQELRRQLDAYGRTTRKHYELTAFLPADPQQIDNGYEVRKVFKLLDFATVQGYDMHGTWDPITNHQSALYPPKGQPVQPDFTVSRAINALIERGAPRNELVLGVPFYGRGWTDVASTANGGLFQTAPTPAPATYEAGYEDYRFLKTLPGFRLYRDRRAGFSWLFDGKTFWTYDDPVVMNWKVDYIRDKRLGGVMAWSLDGDDGQGSLFATLDRRL
jgi:chitinase